MKNLKDNLEKMFEKAFKSIKTQKVPGTFDNKFLSYLKKTKVTVFLSLPQNKISLKNQEIYSHNIF